MVNITIKVHLIWAFAVKTTTPKWHACRISDALTFGEGFLVAFPVDMFEDMVRLPVEVSEGQLTEQLIAVKQTEGIRQLATRVQASLTHLAHFRVRNWGLSFTSNAICCKWKVSLVQSETLASKCLLTVASCSVQSEVHTGCSWTLLLHSVSHISSL